MRLRPLIVFILCWLVVWPMGVKAEESVSHRIVSIGGSVTEIIHALGLSERVIAVDSTSYYPPAMTSKPNVGYRRQLAAEPILALEPSLVLALEDSGPPAVIEQLRDAGVEVVIVPDAPSPGGVMDKIGVISSVLEVEDKAESLRSELAGSLADLDSVLANVGARPRVLFLLSAGSGPPLVAGNRTSAAAIIQLAGGVNAASGFNGYKPLSPEAMVDLAPDVILVTERSLGLLGGAQKLFSLPEMASTPAGRNRRLVTMDDLLLLGFGPRTDKAIRHLARHLHPDIAF